MINNEQNNNENGIIKFPNGITLVKKNEPSKEFFINPNFHPTNVDGHYPAFLTPGASNLINEDSREMSVILESFLPQLEKIGIELKDLNNLIREIILSTEVFRRLKGISQIELLPFAFSKVPWFTRYTHSCLTYVFADYVIEKLNSNLNLNQLDLEASKLCFLIHDLGHGPFSHLTERAFRTPRGRNGKTPKEYDHEYWTKILLNELRENLFDTFKNPYLPKNISSIPNKNLKKSKEYNLNIFSRALAIMSRNELPIISQLLSGQIDLDRLSNYLGDRLVVSEVLEEIDFKKEPAVKLLSSYNQTVENIKRIFHNFIITDIDLNGNKCNPYLAIHENAAKPVMHYLLDRHIIRYYLLKHPKREAANNLLHKILRRAKELVMKKDLDSIGKTDLLMITWLYGNHTEAEFIALNDQLLFNQMRKWAKYALDPLLRDLCLRFTANAFFNVYSVERNGEPFLPDETFLDSLKNAVSKSLKIKGISEELIRDYYFTYDETTSSPYHLNEEEIIIYTNDKKVKKLSDFINDTNDELGKVLLETKFERYLVVFPEISTLELPLP